jgi:TRAP-type mannitol/chloroaromatic compound transport system permease small subunit
MRAVVDAPLRVLQSVVRWLALPLAALLFAQWPLREGLQAWSREANDLAQVIFALYIAVAVSAAGRAGRHFAVDLVAHRFSPRARVELARVCGAVILLPWAAFVIWSAEPMVLSAVMHAERFPETGNPGYVVVKVAVWLLAALMALECIVDIVAPRVPSGDRSTHG